MVSDSIIDVSIPKNGSKDFGKKKRVNRSAKLKQHKLHTRREQWLSQGQVNNKGCKEEVKGGVSCGEFNGPKIETRNKLARYKDLEVQNPPSVGENHHDSDSDLSPENSPTSSVSGGNDSANTYTGSSSISSTSISSSSFSSVGCFSGSMSEQEEVGDGGSDDDCFDDWEAMADALAAEDTNGKQGHNPGGADSLSKKDTAFGSDSAAQVTEHGIADTQVIQSELKSVGILGMVAVSRKAWRADDASRPQTLPNLSKQHSFPANSERNSCFGINPWVRNNVPTSCPICCEDLDLTDTSFLPCSCGFRLCLFCHKRILEDDGRCPGCRKPYDADPVEKETIASGGSLTIRLARSCSMFSRV